MILGSDNQTRHVESRIDIKDMVQCLIGVNARKNACYAIIADYC